MLENNRKCGECQECCTMLQIHEINKPDFQVCPNQYEGGCKIYDDRPNSCRIYECSWHRGAEEHLDRPDREGILISEQYSERYGAWATVHIIHLNAIKKKHVMNRLFELMRQMPVIHMKKNGMELLGGPPDRAKKLLAQINQEGGDIIADGQIVPVSRLIRKQYDCR